MPNRRRRRNEASEVTTVLTYVTQPFKRTGDKLAPQIEPLPDAAPPDVHFMHYGPDFFEEGTIQDWSQLDQLVRSQHCVWIDVDGLGSAEVNSRIAEAFQLHPLAMEDVVHVHQRAKVEEYQSHLFIVARMAEPGEHMNTEQLSIFLGKSFVITFQEGRPGDCFELIRQRLRKGYGLVRERGSDHLAYALLDAVIDGYFPIVEMYGDRLNELDQELTDLGTRVPQGEIHQMRSELLLLRRCVWPHREAINHLLRDANPLITAETRVYLRDCYDHVLQIIDVVETYRDVCSDLRDFYMSMASHRANEIMKVLTIISTIFIPLSFIAGVYGMNFHYMPELSWKYGYLWAWLVMSTVAIALVVFVWRRGWFSN